MAVSRGRRGSGKRAGGRSPRPDTVSEPPAETPATLKLQKVLADAGFGSRREMEVLIQEGKVSVNGQIAHQGQRVGDDADIRVRGRRLERRSPGRTGRVLLYNKVSGEICTRSDPQGRPTVFNRLPRVRSGRWISVGRLDFNTEGLLILTTDGELANQLMHPRYGWDREYAVRVLGRISTEARQMLIDGVALDDGPAAARVVEEIGGDGANAWYRVVLGEGRNREVRRMMEAVGVTVSRLIRVRFGPVQLPRELKRGRWSELETTEVQTLLGQMGAVASPSK